MARTETLRVAWIQIPVMSFLSRMCFRLLRQNILVRLLSYIFHSKENILLKIKSTNSRMVRMLMPRKRQKFPPSVAKKKIHDWLFACYWISKHENWPAMNCNRPFYRYGGHIELIRFKEYYRMPRGAWAHFVCIFERFSGYFFLKFS